MKIDVAHVLLQCANKARANKFERLCCCFRSRAVCFHLPLCDLGAGV
jgi:hypothetical protein